MVGEPEAAALPAGPYGLPRALAVSWARLRTALMSRGVVGRPVSVVGGECGSMALSPIQLGMRCKEALRLSQAEPG